MELTSDQNHQAENMDPIQKSLDLLAQLFFPLNGNEIHKHKWHNTGNSL